MTAPATMALDPSALAAFAATLDALPKDEIRKAKKLYVLNAIADFDASCASGRAMIITMGILCIIPVFLVVFIPGLIGYRSGIRAGRQKILNAIEVWREDFGDDYAAIHARIAS